MHFARHQRLSINQHAVAACAGDVNRWFSRRKFVKNCIPCDAQPIFVKTDFRARHRLSRFGGKTALHLNSRHIRERLREVDNLLLVNLLEHVGVFQIPFYGGEQTYHLLLTYFHPSADERMRRAVEGDGIDKLLRADN